MLHRVKDSIWTSDLIFILRIKIWDKFFKLFNVMVDNEILKFSCKFKNKSKNDLKTTIIKILKLKIN